MCPVKSLATRCKVIEIGGTDRRLCVTHPSLLVSLDRIVGLHPARTVHVLTQRIHGLALLTTW